MSFVSGQGYGNMFGYTGVNVRADGFEMPHLSGTVMRQAIDQLVFSRLLNPSPDAFGVGKGGTFTVPIFQDWGQPGTVVPLVSGTVIGLGTQHTSSIAMSMYEYGTGISYERILDWFTNINVQSQLVRTLGNHIGRMINWLDYDIFANSRFSMEVAAAGSYSFLGTNRQRSGVGTSFGELGPGGLAYAYDIFKKSGVTPMTDRGMYVAVGGAESFRHLKQGSVFQNLQLYGNLQGIRYQILGEFMNFVFIETEEQTGKGTVFLAGKNTGGFGFGKTPQVWYYPDFGSDAGRMPVWKTIFYRGQGPIWRDSGTTVITVRCKTTTYEYGSLG